MKKRLVFVTDCSDVAYSELRGTIFSCLDSDHHAAIEPSVVVAPFSILNGSFMLRLAAEAYPDNTVFSVILNPLQEITEHIVIKTKKKNLTVFSTNTGVLGWLIKDYGIKEAWFIPANEFRPFGGKYIHAPAIGRHLNGVRLSTLGVPFDFKKIRRLDIPEGTVVHIDNFGLVKINIDPSHLKVGKKYKLHFNGKTKTVPFVTRLMSLQDGTWAIYSGSSFGLLELGCARKRHSEPLGLKVGDHIKVIEV